MAKKIPLRQCIGCGEMKSKKEMLRVLRTEDQGIVLDTTGRKNGRGAYICPNPECMERARKSRGLDRAFRMPVPDEIYDSLTKEIELFE
ncbi:MAG: YlxR family protein [Lachnospiraceae bacterium]|nr:YlxR family protein [Lachnospiraceae bacterium]